MKTSNKRKVLSNFKKVLSSTLCCFLASVFLFSVPSTALAAVKVKKTTVTNVKAKSSSAITVKWKKVSGIKGYVIYQKKKGESFSKIKTISKANKTSFTNEGLEAFTKYYYKIKTYTVKNGKKVYGAFSNIKSTKTQKEKKPIGEEPTVDEPIVEKPTVAENRITLKNFIENNYDGINSDWNKFLKDIDYSEYGKTTSAIVYDEVANEFHFICSYDKYSGSESICEMIFDINETNANDVTIIFVWEDEQIAYEAYTTLYLESYDTNDVWFTLEDATFLTEDDIQDLSNSLLRISIYSWETLLIDNLGMTLNDLGFTAI